AGDMIRATFAPAGGYRGAEPAQAIIIGDPRKAERALRASLRRGAAALAVLELVAFAHVMSRRSGVAAAFGAALCESGATTACRTAARLTARAGGPEAWARDLHARACRAGEAPSCLAVQMLDRRALPPQ